MSNPERFTITRVARSEYLLFQDGTDAAVKTGKTPDELSAWAFFNGASHVVHAYDLREAQSDADFAWFSKRVTK